MKAVLNLEAGAEQKELGLYATELNNAEFVALARSIAQLISCQQGSVTMDEVRTHPRLHGWQPSSPNAYGAVFNGKGWRLLGFEPSHVKTNRTRRIGRWTWKP